MIESSRSKSHVPLEDSIPQASLESILCTDELHRRPSRSPDYEKENRALVALVGALADSPGTILQILAETILDITQSDSAGLSLLTRDGKTPDVSGTRFYWPAIVGMWSPHVGGGTPRNFGPCGDVLDQNRALLFRHFERRYRYLMPVVPAADECLLVPFHICGIAVGTIWAILHNERRVFDAEDDRVMASLGKFASSAYQALVSIEDLKTHMAEREKAEAELRELTDSLEVQVRARTKELQRSGEALAVMTRKLIESQEQERARIGRELHDDINQRLALFAVELDRWKQHPPPAGQLNEQIRHAQERINQIARDVQGLSHRLHSSKLEYLGLSTAANSFCKEMSEQSKVEVQFNHGGIPRDLPKEVALCLFRVLQEALQNAVKHSGVRSFRVDLRGTEESIELTVADRGIGFEEHEAFTRHGLGLISMRERLQLVHGEVSVKSRPGAGTTIYARVPRKTEEYRAMAG